MERLKKMMEAINAVMYAPRCKRKITHIVIHCTGGHPGQSVDSIRAYWRKMGWKKPGYHLLIDAAGNYNVLSHIDNVVNGVRGHNAHSIHIAYVGGLDGQDTRTAPQIMALQAVVELYHERFPEARICGHRDLSPDTNGNGKVDPLEWLKTCPCFDVETTYKRILNQ